MADDWVDVPAVGAAPAPAADGWVDVPKAGEAPAAGPSPPISGPNGWSEAAKPFVNSTPVGGIMKAFGQGFREASGPEKLGLSPENKKWLDGIGKGKWYEEPFRGFNEGVILPTAVDLDGAMRMFMGTYRGLQAAGVEAGLPRDVVSLPDAFAGSPGALGEIRMRPGLPPDLARVIEEAPKASETAPASASAAGLKLVDAPEGGVYTPDQFKTGEKYFKAVDADGNVAAEMLVKIDGKTARIEDILNPSAPREDGVGTIGTSQMLGLVKQFREAHPEVTELTGNRISGAREGGKYDLGARNDIAVMLPEAKDLGVIGPERPPITEGTPKEVAERVTSANADQPPGEKVTQELPGDKPNPWRERFDSFVGKIKTDGDAKQLLRDAADQNDDFLPARQGNIPLKQDATRGFEYGYRDDDGRLFRTTPDGRKEYLYENSNTFESRWVDAEAGVGSHIVPRTFKDKASADAYVKEFAPIGQEPRAASEPPVPNPTNRGAGPIPLRQMMDLGDAAGIDPGMLDRHGIGRLLQNDNQVRNAMQAMLTATEHVKDAAREVKADSSPENLMKMQEALLRRDTWVEQVVGHRAEWGRTGNVFQEFLQKVKDEKSFNEFLKNKDLSPEGLKKIAGVIDNMNGAQAAKLLSNLNKPGAWDKFKYYWVNALISGPITHTKYIVANAAYAGYEAAVVTPIAGASGAVRRGIYGGTEGVYMGEAAARTYGLIAGVPDAAKAAVAAVKTGMQTPLPGELAQSIIPKNNKNIFFQQRPIPGKLGAMIGAPSRVASGIHSFYNFLGYRASIEAQAYRSAASEGLKLNDDAFWQRRQAIADAPTVDMMNAAIEDGYRATFISELGPAGKAMSNFVKSTKVGQIIMPFTHIPLVILERAMEGGPLAFLDPETRATLSGKDYVYKDAFGNEKTKPFTEVKRDMAVGRLVAGSAAGAWILNQVLNDRATGSGPTDPKERAQWIATGHQPYSVRIGDYWYSYNRFGPLGTMMGLYSNLAEVIPHMKADSEELTKAIAMTVHSTGKLLEDEVGMQGFAGLVDTIEHPIEKGPRYLANMTGSLLPFSSAQRQIASSMDPYMRETKSVVDGLRYYIPMARQGLEFKRDWLGAPISNAGYGGDLPVPGLSSIIQHGDARPDPLALEMQALDLHPAKPLDRIGGVKLTPKLYDTYQATAGPLTRTALEGYINQPGWHDIPLSVRQDIFRNTISSARQVAGAAMQMRYPQIIQQGVDQTTARIKGEKPPKMKDPSLIMNGPPGSLGSLGIRG